MKADEKTNLKSTDSSYGGFAVIWGHPKECHEKCKIVTGHQVVRITHI
jgi:hypothetical protein